MPRQAPPDPNNLLRLLKDHAAAVANAVNELRVWSKAVHPSPASEAAYRAERQRLYGEIVHGTLSALLCDDLGKKHPGAKEIERWAKRGLDFIQDPFAPNTMTIPTPDVISGWAFKADELVPDAAAAWCKGAASKAKQGRPSKGEQRTKHAAFLTFLLQHPSMKGDPAELAHSIGVDVRTIRRWLEGEAKRYQESRAECGGRDDDDRLDREFDQERKRRSR